MNIRSLVIASALLMCVGISMYSQGTTDRQRASLRRMRSDMDATKRQIDALIRQESLKKKSLTTIEKKQAQISSALTALQSKLSMLQDSAHSIDASIQQTTTALERASAEYEDVAQAMVKQATLRHGHSSLSYMIPFRELSRKLEVYRNEKLHLRDSLLEQQQLLQEVSTTQQSIIVQQAAQRKSLQALSSNQRSELQKIRSSKSLLVSELAKKRESASRMSSLIQKLEQAAEEKKRMMALQKQRESKKNTQQPAPVEIPTARGFGSHSLPWPTPGKTLLNPFGTYTDHSSGTTFTNPGIDIKAPTGTSVTSVAPGTVSSVTWLPGFGSLVIVDHHNGFRSVYANLQSASVSKGSNVRAGTIVGQSGENIDGQLAHFELWNGRTKLNPITYLR